MHPEIRQHMRFHTRSMLDKAINGLVGLVEGIALDSRVNEYELRFLKQWALEHGDFRNLHPYSELIPIVEGALADGILTADEQQDLLWLCERLQSAEYYSETTGAMQRLHGILAGIASDGIVSVEELKALRGWCDAHEHLRTCWPYDEIDSLITSTLSDGKIDSAEQKMLLDFFTEFTAFLDNRTVVTPSMIKDGTVQGVCASCPEIIFPDRVFCFTGASSRYTRAVLADMVRDRQGIFRDTISHALDYLVIGAEGNPTWAYACYGRKVEQAVQLRKNGARLILIHEHDFHDAIQDG